VRLLSRLYFAAGLHRLRLRCRSPRRPTREEQHLAEHGPTQLEVVVAALAWLVVLLALVRLALLVLHGPRF
jgi:hypothetical protein